MAGQTIRVPITVKFILNSTGKTVWSASSAVKTRIRNLTSEALAQNKDILDFADIRMEATIMYSRANDSWNSFNFKTMAEFDEKMGPVLELGLLRDLKDEGMLEEKYLA